MPPLATKGKGKGRDRRSRSRNTTPNSVISSSVPSIPVPTAYLNIDTSSLLIPPSPQYAEMFEKLDLKQGMPDPLQLESLLDQLSQLSKQAESRSQTCHRAMTALSEKLKEIAEMERERERERQDREAEARRARMRKEAKEAKEAREAEASDDELASKKNGKRSKRKDRPNARDERPMAHGAHHIARQDRMDIKSDNDGNLLDTSSPSKRARMSPGSSSLSEVAPTPEATTAINDKASPEKNSSAASSDDERQPIPAPPVTQHAYFPDPLAPDPVNYEIQEVTNDMTDEEKKKIYSVAAFPTKDLSDQIAGTPPDKDFSNAKPTNQTAANTFLTYVEPYVRQLTEEDSGFLRERGDRVTPFIIPARGKKHFKQTWAEEDNASHPAPSDNGSINRASGTVEDVDDDTLGTDRVSGGPLANRLLSLLRFEHRNPPAENGGLGGTANGTGPNDSNGLFGSDGMDLDSLGNLDPNDAKPLPSASSVAEQHAPKANNAANDIGGPASDDRIKDELRYLGFLGVDEEPDFEAHNDDDISERMRLLQAELKAVMIRLGAKKAILSDKAKEDLAFQEYKTIHEDLDNQVQQAYLKRTRTLGKSKKGHAGASASGRPRANGAAGPSGQAGAAGLARQRDIGDSARILMDRRDRWGNCIGPIFEDMKQGVPASVEKGGKSLFDPETMVKYEQAEREAIEEEWGETGL